MRAHTIRIIAAVTLALAVAGRASAQTGAQMWKERAWVSISGGTATAASGAFTDTFDIERYAETGHVTVGYPSKSGLLVAGAVDIRVWRNLAVGVGVTQASTKSDGNVSASIPHPFFDNQLRAISGSTSIERDETGIHVQLAWLVPAGRHLRVAVSGGPSYITLAQTVATNVTFSESYPYDTATFTGATTERPSKGAVGFNAGVDTAWMFSKNVGAGVMAQFSRATVKLPAGDRTISRTAGGGQIGAGIRFVF